MFHRLRFRLAFWLLPRGYYVERVSAGPKFIPEIWASTGTGNMFVMTTGHGHDWRVDGKEAETA